MENKKKLNEEELAGVTGGLSKTSNPVGDTAPAAEPDCYIADPNAVGSMAPGTGCDDCPYEASCRNWNKSYLKRGTTL